jgi:hypothetical protein
MNGNAYKKLATLVDAVEKLALLPENEFVKNTKLVAEIRNAFEVHNLDSIINSSLQEMREIQNMHSDNNVSQDQLIHAYAQREHERVKGIDCKDKFITKIINDDNEIEEIKIESNEKADEKFSSVFNTVYADGAVKINVTGDPSTLMSYIDYTPYRLNYIDYLSVPTLSEMVDKPLAIAFKDFPTVDSKNKKFNEAVKKLISKNNIESVIKDALFY